MSQEPSASPDTNIYAQFERTLKLRIGFSVSLFAIFLIVSIIFLLTKASAPHHNAIRIGLFIVSILAMPRKTLPATFKQTPESKPFAQQMYRVKNWLAMTRFAFFSLALCTLYLLPRLL